MSVRFELKVFVVVLLALVQGCASLTPATRAASLETDSTTCESFITFDQSVRSESAELVQHAPGDQLVTASATLARARRACARHVLTTLLDRRERLGPDAMQRELDAMARAFTPATLEGLVHDALGADEAALRPWLAEAWQNAARHPATDAGAQQAAAAVRDADTTCNDGTPCEKAGCAARAGLEPKRVTSLARACLDQSATLEPLARASATAALIDALRTLPPSGVLTEALTTLETLRRQRWPEVEQALAQGHPSLAARLATPFAALDAARADVERVRLAAVHAHLDRAREAGANALAVRLHRRLAAVFGNTAEPPLSPEPGHWATAKWSCTFPAPPMPAAFAAVELRVLASCDRRDTPGPSASDPANDFVTARVALTLTASCADRTSSFRETVPDVPVSSLGRDEVLAPHLEKLVAQARERCTTLVQQSLTASCDELDHRPAAALEETFTRARVITGTWAPCFSRWFEQRTGVPPSLAD